MLDDLESNILQEDKVESTSNKFALNRFNLPVSQQNVNILIYKPIFIFYFLFYILNKKINKKIMENLDELDKEFICLLKGK